MNEINCDNCNVRIGYGNVEEGSHVYCSGDCEEEADKKHKEWLEKEEKRCKHPYVNYPIKPGKYNLSCLDCGGKIYFVVYSATGKIT